MYVGLEISDKKNYSREDKNSRNNWFVPAKFRLFHRTDNSRNYVPNHSAELGILYRETKIEANSRNFLPNYSLEEKTTRNSVPWNKKRRKLSEFRSEAFGGRKHALNSVCWSRIFSSNLVPLALELTLP
jgi:hypothetical protein